MDRQLRQASSTVCNPFLLGSSYQGSGLGCAGKQIRDQVKGYKRPVCSVHCSELLLGIVADHLQHDDVVSERQAQRDSLGSPSKDLSGCYRVLLGHENQLPLD